MPESLLYLMYVDTNESMCSSHSVFIYWYDESNVDR